jgi:hypothetical protein
MRSPRTDFELRRGYSVQSIKSMILAVDCVGFAGRSITPKKVLVCLCSRLFTKMGFPTDLGELMDRSRVLVLLNSEVCLIGRSTVGHYS